MAKKAGQLLTGATKVKAALETGEAIALLTATDAAEDGKKKLMATLKASSKAAEELGLPGGKPSPFRIAEFRRNWVWRSGLKM